MQKRKITITLPEDILKEIQDAATTACRSVSAEIEFRMRHWTSVDTLPAFNNFKRTTAPTPENPTGQTHIPTSSVSTLTSEHDTPFTPAYFTDKEGLVHKKHPLTWLRENNIDPLDTSMATYNEVKKAFPDMNLLEFDNYQQSRRK